MLFGDAEREYGNLKAQFDAGRLSEADFRARLEEMMIEDDEGKWWSIGYETGKWYYHDGEQWVRGDPPAEKSPTTPATVTRSAATGVQSASSASATVEPSGTAPGNLAASPIPVAASVAGSSDPSARASATKEQVTAPGRPKPVLAAAIGAFLVLVLAAGAFVLLSRSGPTAATADAGSGQAGSGATVSPTPPEISQTAVAVVAALRTATSTPTDTESKASVPPADTATLQPPTSTPSATLPPPTATPTASPAPDTPTPTPEPPTFTPEPPTPTPEPPTPTAEPPKPTLAPTATRRPAPTPTRAPAAAQPAAAAPAVPGLVTGFEQWGTWSRGNQPNGAFKQSTEEKHSGSASGRLDYKFPAAKDNFVVFLPKPSLSIPGTPAALSIWVLGDGSGHYLNVWVQDSQKELRQFWFGAVPAAGTWQKLTATLDTSAPWPQGHIPGTGPDNGKLDYPIRLYAIVLDALADGVPYQGTIYLDDIMAAPGS